LLPHLPCHQKQLQLPSFSLKAVQINGSPHANLFVYTQVLSAPEGEISLIFSERELDEALTMATNQGKVLVVFNALTWCRPCEYSLKHMHASCMHGSR
jgi:hypothetical protein